MKLLLLVLAFPGLLVNDWSAGLALRRAGATYAELDVSATSPNLLDKRLQVTARDLCFEHARASGCFSSVELDVTVRLWRPALTAVDRLVLTASRLDVRPAPEKPEEPKPAARRRLPPLPRVGYIRLEAPSFTYDKLKGSAFGLHEDRRFELRASLPQGRVDGRGVYGEGLVDAVLRAEAGPRAADAVVRVSSSAARLTLDLREPGRTVRARLAGTPTRVRGDVAVVFSTGPLREARLTGCDARREGKRGFLDCGLRAVLRAAVLKTLDGKLHAEGDASAVKVDVVFKPKRDFYRASASANLRRDEDGALEHDFDVLLDVPRFEKLAEFLAGTRFSVPAPLHVLKGPLRVQARGAGRDVAVEARSDLRSERQRVKLTASGAVDLERKRPLVEADVFLEEVELELPRLNIGPMPDVTFDKRIKAGELPAPRPQAKRPPPNVEARVSVKTGKPALLRSNLAKDPIPVALDLRVQPPQLDGTIQVRAFDVELFRRAMTVEHFHLRPAGGRAFDMDGLIVAKLPDYTVKIMLVGSTVKPRVEFLSDPPLERDQIIALLLFNKPPDVELEESEQESVGNTQNALASNALGLATLYLFASTPIEYVGYDPATQGYSVRFKLPGGASMEVGGNDQEKRLTLRKRLTSHWALQTEVRNEEDVGNAATTFLEWFNRF